MANEQAETPEMQQAAPPAAPLELVVAVAENDVIGRDNQLPWHLPADLRHFKALTLGKHLLMGRKTYESIGKALPGRTNVVLSRSLGFAPKDCKVVASLKDALAIAGTSSAPLMVIGGAEVYGLCIGLAQRIHLTLVHIHVADGDAYFDGWRGSEWRETFRQRHEPDERHSCGYSFVTLKRGA